MKNIHRILLSLAVLMLGVAMIPVMGLPVAGFTWQRFADVYLPTTLEVDHPSGQPGSYFTITGMNYPVDADLDVHVNGVLLGSVHSDLNGNAVFVISTTGAALGYYTVVLGQVNDVYTRFELIADAPLWPQVGEAPVLPLPADIANRLIFLPAIRR
jgi:hypothetical protein